MIKKQQNKKGFTVVELMLAFTLSLIVIVYLFNVIFGIKNLYTDNGIRTQMLIKQSGLSEEIGNIIQSKLITKINTCGGSCLRFQFADFSTTDLSWNEGNRTIRFSNHQVQYVKGSEIGIPDVHIEKVADVKDNQNNSIVTIHIPVTHKLVDEDFGVLLVYPYDDRVTDIPDIGPDDFISVKLTGNVASGTPTNKDVILTAHPRPAEKDMLGGYTYTWQRQEGGTFKTIATNREDKLTISADANHYYRVIIKNVDGNTATSNTYKVIVDKTLPTCSIDISGTMGNNNWYKTNAVLTLTTNDGSIGSGVASYDLTNKATASYKGTKAVTQGDTKSETYYGYVKDTAGNTATCGSATVKVDTSAPVCASSGGSTTWTNTSRTLSGTCTDSLSGCTGNVSKGYTTQGDWTSQSPGTVYDNAGNSVACPANQTVRIDKTAPTCSVSVSGTAGNNGWYRSKTTNTLNKNDTGGSGIASYGLTTNTTTTYNGVVTASQGDTSAVIWRGYIKDAAGNTATCATTTYKVDATAPSVSISNSSGGKWTKSNIVLTLKSNESGSGMANWSYSYNNSSFKTYSDSASTNFKTSAFSQERNQTVYIRAVDRAGNMATGTTPIKIDKTAYTPWISSVGNGNLSCNNTSQTLETGRTCTISNASRAYLYFDTDVSDRSGSGVKMDSSGIWTNNRFNASGGYCENTGPAWGVWLPNVQKYSLNNCTNGTWEIKTYDKLGNESAILTINIQYTH